MRALTFILGLLCLPGVPGCASNSSSQSVKPGINDSYLDPDLDVVDFVKRFETESREVFQHRQRITDALELKPGMAIADIGAGTGIYLEPFDQAVRPDGTVYAVDIVPKFIDRLNWLAKEEGLQTVQTVLCREDSVELPLESVDVVFLCDTYHHFEYPLDSLKSIHRALRPGGHLFIIDFIRIEGVSRDWILEHVRTGEDGVTSEVESMGFRKLDSSDLGCLKENYFLRFVKE